MQLFRADWVHTGDAFQGDGALLIDDEGRVVFAGAAAEVERHPQAAGAERRVFEDTALLPGTISAHSHCFQVFLRGPGDHPRSFQDWVAHYLYPLVRRLDLDSLEAAALLCFSQMLRAGVTSVGEFHYLHNDLEFEPQSEELARVVIGAARRVGLRVAFLRTIYDVQERLGQGRFAEPAAEALANTRALHQAYADDPYVSILPAPHSLHGATEEAVQGAAQLAAELGTPWHIHLAEQKGDVGYAMRQHSATPLRVLEDWGVLDERTVLVHGIWLDAFERALLAGSGRGLVTNPTTNMALGDGIAPLAELMRAGVPVAVGTDMNATPNVFLEMRSAELMQRVEQLRMGVLAGLKGEPDPQRVLDMGTRHAAFLLGLEAGALEPGRWADVIALDLSDPSLLPASYLGGPALLSVLTTTMVAETAVRHAFVAGREVLRDGAVLGISQSELAERVRAAQAVC